jgi:hypothetical protein
LRQADRRLTEAELARAGKDPQAGTPPTASTTCKFVDPPSCASSNLKCAALGALQSPSTGIIDSHR